MNKIISKNNNIKLLMDILTFLNEVPNRKYGDNYILASDLQKFIYDYDDTIFVLRTLKNDAMLAIKDKWDCSKGNVQDILLDQLRLIDSVIN